MNFNQVKNEFDCSCYIFQEIYIHGVISYEAYTIENDKKVLVAHFHSLSESMRWLKNQDLLEETQRQLAEALAEIEKLKELAYKDKLTSLFNRRKFDDDVNGTVYNSVLYLDLNDLKVANDTIGHEEGDRLLKILSDNIRSVEDRCYRLGGDEFAILLNVTQKNLMGIIERLQNVFFESGVKVSTGWAHIDNDGAVKGLVTKAEERMYQEKKRTKAGR